MFKKYLRTKSFDPLFAIVVNFTSAAVTSMHTVTGRRYIRRLNPYSYLAVQKPFKITLKPIQLVFPVGVQDSYINGSQLTRIEIESMRL